MTCSNGLGTFLSGQKWWVSVPRSGLSPALGSQLATLGSPSLWEYAGAFASCGRCSDTLGWTHALLGQAWFVLRWGSNGGHVA